MKAYWILAGVILAGCQKSEMVSEFTGNQASYGLTQASQYTISGAVTFKERKDGSTTVTVQLIGTDGSSQFPVHMHLGDVTSTGSLIAYPLNPVNAKTGKSETIVSQLADETHVSYKDLLKLTAYINVHLASFGDESKVILAAGNVGSNGIVTASGARLQIGVCASY